ncbi:hypothetical protein R6Q59_024675 [Mikania micrantha]
MDNNGIFSNTLGLEISLNHQQTTGFHNQQPPFAAAPVPAKQAYPYSLKQKASPISDEEELLSNNLNIPTNTDDSGTGDGILKKGSPWQRMKWTDNMVRLLIMVVFYVGDEVGSEQAHVQTPGSGTAVKKSGAGSGGVLQKKGKWKSVSKAMMERGFYVSPQQCEDKFNDLNKRYKRVNDILGKGTACKVVEDQSLLESMENIPAKLKEEAKKLLNSKHLFFREMCAYHNSSASTGVTDASPNRAGITHNSSPPDAYGGEKHIYHHHRQRCVHSNDNEDDDDEEEDEDEHNGDGQEDEDEDDGLNNRKRTRDSENEWNESAIHRFSDELSCVTQDLTKSVWEKRQWMKMKMMQLEEQRLGFEDQTYELEKRRFRWVKFCWSREREMELEKVRNERMRIENERMVILLRQKEVELVGIQ